MSDDTAYGRRAQGGPLHLVAAGVPIALALLAVALPYHTPLMRAVSVAMVAIAGTVPAVLYFAMRSRVKTVEDSVRDLSRGNLSRQLPSFDDEALAPIIGELDSLRENMRARLSDMADASDEQDRSVSAAKRDLNELAQGVQRQVSAIEDTATSLQEMSATLKGLAENVETLASAAEEASSSILEMAAANQEVADNMATLSSSVSDSVGAIEQMTFSIKDVAKNVEDLSSTAEETSSSMNEMDISIHQVETNANETARLSEEVTKAAGLGVEAINQTIHGINRIKDSSEEAVKVIATLGNKIGEIGKILEVIDDVAEQTNLLALNAAIIAAQAGEHGKGFAVVADEIKDLAERAGASTKEIADLNKAVQAESR
ncbi:MAG: methyl-accepting protein, partial [Deltaproteobacteria bacterium]|nr:methyl-accepting protein [Deltaproteobacteria bacterium]